MVQWFWANVLKLDRVKFGRLLGSAEREELFVCFRRKKKKNVRNEYKTF